MIPGARGLYQRTELPMRPFIYLRLPAARFQNIYSIRDAAVAGSIPGKSWITRKPNPVPWVFRPLNR